MPNYSKHTKNSNNMRTFFKAMLFTATVIILLGVGYFSAGYFFGKF